MISFLIAIILYANLQSIYSTVATCFLPPMIEPSCEIDRIETTTFESINCSLATIAASAVDQISIFFLELVELVIQIHQGNVL
jgi:hypothetical protein